MNLVAARKDLLDGQTLFPLFPFSRCQPPVRSRKKSRIHLIWIISHLVDEIPSIRGIRVGFLLRAKTRRHSLFGSCGALPHLHRNPSLLRVSLWNLNKLSLSNPSPPVLTLPGEPNPDPNPPSWLAAAGLRIGIAKAGQFDFSKPKTLFSNIPYSREGIH